MCGEELGGTGTGGGEPAEGAVVITHVATGWEAVVGTGAVVVTVG